MDTAVLVDELAGSRIGETFNQYAEGARAGLLRERLVAYLGDRAEAPLLLVGEAAGYRGARVSGLPFTSERQLTGDGPAEATSTMVQRVLRELDLAEDVLLWNVVPTHPGTRSSNRRPTRDEIAAGLPFAKRLAHGRRVVAVGRIAESALGAPYVRHPSRGGAAEFAAMLVGEVFGAQLIQGTLGLLEAGETHARKHPRRLGELDVAVVDHLPAVAPWVEEVVAAGHLRSGCVCRRDRRRPVVDDETDVAVAVGLAAPTLRQRDELVADVDERHPRALAPQPDLEDPPEERECLVDVADIDGDVVYPYEPRHLTRTLARC